MADRIEMLAKAKERNWFYRFPLPDGTVTKTHLSDAVEKIHTARRDALVNIIKSRVPNARAETALDLASHEGYFSVELAKHFKTVQGLEYRQESARGLGICAPQEPDHTRAHGHAPQRQGNHA